MILFDVISHIEVDYGYEQAIGVGSDPVEGVGVGVVFWFFNVCIDQQHVLLILVGLQIQLVSACQTQIFINE